MAYPSNDEEWMDEDEYTEVDFEFLKRKHNTDGYREGITSGKEYILQSSFNDGFKAGITCYEALSKYRGCLSAILLYLMTIQGCPSKLLQKVENMVSKFEELETNNNILQKMTMNQVSDQKHQTHPVGEDTNNGLRVTDTDFIDLSEMMSNANTSESENLTQNNISSCKKGKCNSCKCSQLTDEKRSTDIKSSADEHSDSNTCIASHETTQTCAMHTPEISASNKHIKDELNTISSQMILILDDLQPFVGDAMIRNIKSSFY